MGTDRGAEPLCEEGASGPWIEARKAPNGMMIDIRTTSMLPPLFFMNQTPAKADRPFCAMQACRSRLPSAAHSKGISTAPVIQWAGADRARGGPFVSADR